MSERFGNWPLILGAMLVTIGALFGAQEGYGAYQAAGHLRSVAADPGPLRRERKASQLAKITQGPMPIDRAMTRIASAGRDQLPAIRPTRSTDPAPAAGWMFAPGYAAPPKPDEEEEAPAPEEPPAEEAAPTEEGPSPAEPAEGEPADTTRAPAEGEPAAPAAPAAPAPAAPAPAAPTPGAPAAAAPAPAPAAPTAPAAAAPAPAPAAPTAPAPTPAGGGAQ